MAAFLLRSLAHENLLIGAQYKSRNFRLSFFDIWYDSLLICPDEITPNNAIYRHIQYDTLLLDHTMNYWELCDHAIKVYMLDCIDFKPPDAVIIEQLHDNYAQLWQALEDGVLNDDPDAFFDLRVKYRESMALTAHCRFKRHREALLPVS